MYSKLGFYAHVFRGAFRYHYGNMFGLMPASYSLLKYSAFDKSGKAQGVNIGNWSLFQANPNILIYRNLTSGFAYSSDEVFSTTIHETCHSTHGLIMNAGWIQYSQVSDAIAESWPVAVEWFITSMEYRERGIPDYGRETYSNVTPRGFSASYPLDRGYQYWPYNSSAKYSSVFIDLVDDFNQFLRFFPDFNYTSNVNDNVTGYTLANIERTFLKHVYGLSSLRTQLKANKPNGVTDEQIDELMNNF